MHYLKNLWNYFHFLSIYNSLKNLNTSVILNPTSSNIPPTETLTGRIYFWKSPVNRSALEPTQPNPTSDREDSTHVTGYAGAAPGNEAKGGWKLPVSRSGIRLTRQLSSQFFKFQQSSSETIFTHRRCHRRVEHKVTIRNLIILLLATFGDPILLSFSNTDNVGCQ